MQRGLRTALGVFLVVLVGMTAAPAQSRQAVGGPGLVRLAEDGDSWAQTRLGFMLATGRGLAQNYVEAAYWYHRAAEQGHPDAQYFLANFLNLGKGVRRDWVQSHKWFNLSASRTKPGEEQEHRARMRDAIASKLTAAEFEKAQRLAIMWHPKPERGWLERRSRPRIVCPPNAAPIDGSCGPTITIK